MPYIPGEERGGSLDAAFENIRRRAEERKLAEAAEKEEQRRKVAEACTETRARRKPGFD